MNIVAGSLEEFSVSIDSYVKHILSNILGNQHTNQMLLPSQIKCL